MEIPTKKLALSSINFGASKPELVAFGHACLWSPVPSTLEAALEREYIAPNALPGLTLETFRKYTPNSEATIKGHMDNERKNQRSTKPEEKPEDKTKEAPKTIEQQFFEDAFPTQPTDGKRSHLCFVKVVTITGQVHSDLTGRFPIPSSRGYHYLLVVYDYDINSILFTPTKSRKAEELLRAYQSIHQRLLKAGCRPQLQRLDNECSQAFKDFLNDKEVDYQLVPPDDHRRNAAERAIRTAKKHLIAGWCSADSNFPMHLWDETLEYGELALNLLRGSRINPKLSAYEQLSGRFDVNRTPLAPPGIRCLAHVKPSKRLSWGTHAIDAWYVGPATDSYRCHKVYTPDTSATCIVNAVTWITGKLALPVATPLDLLQATMEDLNKILNHPRNERLLTELTPRQHEALVQVAGVFTDKPLARTTMPRITIKKPSAKASTVDKPAPKAVSGNVKQVTASKRSSSYKPINDCAASQ